MILAFSHACFIFRRNDVFNYLLLFFAWFCFCHTFLFSSLPLLIVAAPVVPDGIALRRGELSFHLRGFNFIFDLLLFAFFFFTFFFRFFFRFSFSP